MAITEPTSFYRKGQVIRCMSNEEPEVPADAKMLLSVNKQNREYYVVPTEGTKGGENVEQSAVEKLWLVVRSVKEQNGRNGYRLAVGDVVKFGRVKVRIKEINTEAQSVPTVTDLSDLVAVKHQDWPDSESFIS